MCSSLLRSIKGLGLPDQDGAALLHEQKQVEEQRYQGQLEATRRLQLSNPHGTFDLCSKSDTDELASRCATIRVARGSLHCIALSVEPSHVHGPNVKF